MTNAAPLVLVVEDDPDVLDLEEEALVRRGYRVARARHGEEALQRIAESEPQLILLDMRMPVMDGWAFARAFRERYGRRIPIVVVTAAEDSRLRADEVGADADLGKPFELEQLYEVVADTLGDR
jgi:CheY-like chemotaxis protein